MKKFCLEENIVLTVNLYQNIEEFCLLQNSSIQENLYICPGPLVADGVRALLGKNAEVVTIAKWVNDQLKATNQKRIMKSELLLRLSSVWRHYFPAAHEQIFFRAFEIFTDFRSFTLEANFLSEVLGELDPELKKSVLIFWVYFENEKLVDEQLAYKLVSGNLDPRSLCFMGFKHMNAVQIDMIKELSDNKHVTVAFPLAVYKDTLPSDWIRWLLPESKTNEEENNNSDFEVMLVGFQKNKLNYHLKKYRKIEMDFDVVIPSATMEITQFQEVLNSDLFLKTNVDLFETEKEKIFSELGKQELCIAGLQMWLVKNKKMAIASENYRAFKLYSMIEESLEIFQEIAIRLDAFYISVMNQVIGLNSPRNFYVSLSEHARTKVMGLEEWRFEKIASPVVIVGSSSYGALSAKEKPYNEKILGILSAIGPLKRAGLDFLFAKETLLKLLRLEKSVLFLEDGLLNSDLSWREILKNTSFKRIEADINYAMKEKRDIVKEKTKFKKQDEVNISASKLQTYLDCPRKYYFSSLEKLDTRPEVRLSLDPDEKGILEHKIIEEYLQKFPAYKIEQHFDLCQQILQDFIKKKQVKLSQQLKEETFYELLEYTKNGISSLLTYKQNYPGSTLSFETEFQDSKLPIKGFIDCILTVGNEVHIFDFKRSATSIGSKKELLHFEKIQLWVYRWAQEKKFTVAWWGYINLSDGSMSGLSAEEATIAQEFDGFLNDLVIRYKKEVEFAPLPRHEKVCHYCQLKLLCPKERVV